MPRRSKRTWFLAAIAGVILLAVIAHLMGGELTTALRDLHGPR